MSACRRRDECAAPALAIRVGETRDEAMNDDVEHFEQCVDVTYSLEGEEEDAVDDPSTTDDAEVGGYTDCGVGCGKGRTHNDDDDDVCDPVQRHAHVWISDHLLAFRYVRVIVDPRDGYEFPSPSSDDVVVVVCLAHMPELRMRGTFAVDGGTETSATEEGRNLDSRIWHAAVHTLRLCTHRNFIVDGEREREHVHLDRCIFRFIVRIAR